MSDHDQSERRNTKLESLRRSPKPKGEKGSGPIGKTRQKAPASPKARRPAVERSSAQTGASGSSLGGVVTAADMLAVKAARAAGRLHTILEDEASDIPEAGQY